MNPWKPVSLSKYIIEKTSKNSMEKKLEVFSVTNKKGLVKSEEFFKKTVHSKSVLKYKIIERDEIAYNPSRINVGSAAVCEKESGLLSPIYVVFECSNELIPKFLVNFLKSKEGMNKIKHFSQNGVRHSLNFENLSRMTINLPNRDIQKEVVSICNFIQNIKNNRKKSIEISDDIILSQFLDLFGDPNLNSKKWKFVDLKSKLLEEPQNGIYVNESDYGSGTSIARIDSFYGGILEEDDKLKKVRISKKDNDLYCLNENDIILSRTNSLAYLGKCALIEDLSKKTVFESNMMRIRVNSEELLPQFLIAYFLTNFARNHIAKRAKKAANQVSINQKDIMSMQIPDIPITSQQGFADLVKKWFNLKKNLKKDLSILEELITSMEFELFNGKIPIIPNMIK